MDGRTTDLHSVPQRLGDFLLFGVTSRDCVACALSCVSLSFSGCPSQVPVAQPPSGTRQRRIDGSWVVNEQIKESFFVSVWLCYAVCGAGFLVLCRSRTHFLHCGGAEGAGGGGGGGLRRPAKYHGIGLFLSILQGNEYIKTTTKKAKEITQ